MVTAKKKDPTKQQQPHLASRFQNGSRRFDRRLKAMPCSELLAVCVCVYASVLGVGRRRPNFHLNATTRTLARNSDL